MGCPGARGQSKLRERRWWAFGGARVKRVRPRAERLAFLSGSAQHTLARLLVWGLVSEPNGGPDVKKGSMCDITLP